MKQIDNNGFTLIELLIAMVISTIIGALMASAYEVQVRGKNTQDALTDMNQTARAALEIMTSEIRMAGLDALETANARILMAADGELIFSLDRGDGATNKPNGDCCDTNEVIRYHLNNDADDDGVNDNIASGVGCHLGRETGGGLDPAQGCGGRNGLQPLARNVDALNFVYLDVNGNPIATPVADTDAIRSIEITIVARAGTAVSGFLYDFTNNDTYANQQLQNLFTAPGDKFRRLRMTTSVNCRNIGL